MRFQSYTLALLAAFGVLVCGSQTTPTGINTQAFYDLCKDNRVGSASAQDASRVCLAYIAGAIDTIRTVDTSRGNTFRSGICVPSSSKPNELSLVFLNWVDKNPQSLHTPAVSSLMKSLRDGYPCKS